MHPIVEAILTTRPIEDLLGWALSNQKHNDAGLITRHPTLANVPNTLTVSSPVGPSGSPLPQEYSSTKIGGQGLFPTIAWSAPESIKAQIKEWAVVSEDPDAPMPEPIMHGIYYGINSTKIELKNEDLEVESKEEKRCKGGFWYGASRTGDVYIAPRPIARHGEHRYIFSVFGLGEKVDWTAVREKVHHEGIGKDELVKAIDGKVLACGEWIGTFERK